MSIEDPLMPESAPSFASNTAGELSQAIARAAQVADIIGVATRLPAYVSPDNLFEACADSLQRANAARDRHTSFSGRRRRHTIERSKRLEFWRSEIRRFDAFKEVFVDIES